METIVLFRDIEICQQFRHYYTPESKGSVVMTKITKSLGAFPNAHSGQVFTQREYWNTKCVLIP